MMHGTMNLKLWMAFNPFLKTTVWFEDFPDFARLLF
jgi:hypothetical protein